jgi:hypothetical protein
MGLAMRKAKTDPGRKIDEAIATLGEARRQLGAQPVTAPPLLTEDQVAARLRVSKGRLRKLESLVSIAVDLGEAGLRWEPEAFEGWLVAQQGRGAAA